MVNLLHMGCSTDYGLWHLKCTHSPRQLALESGIYCVPRIAELYV